MGDINEDPECNLECVMSVISRGLNLGPILDEFRLIFS